MYKGGGGELLARMFSATMPPSVERLGRVPEQVFTGGRRRESAEDGKGPLCCKFASLQTLKKFTCGCLRSFEGQAVVLPCLLLMQACGGQHLSMSINDSCVHASTMHGLPVQRVLPPPPPFIPTHQPRVVEHPPPPPYPPTPPPPRAGLWW
jgi:hypothetical protein